MKRIQLQTVDYQISSEKIPPEFEGFCIAVLADLHNCFIDHQHDTLLGALMRGRPDCIMLAGDMITENKRGNRPVGFETAFDLIHRLCRIAPVYYALGNHEQRWKEHELPDRMPFARWREMLESWGVEFLDNTSALIQKGDRKIQVSGLSLPGTYFAKLDRHRPDEKTIRQLLGRPDPACFQILLAHTPAYFAAYQRWGADLVLSGHYHGGIIRLPVLGGVISTSYLPFPKYDHGLFRREESTMIVSSGLGWHTIPVRINNPPELVTITLHARPAAGKPDSGRST